MLNPHISLISYLIKSDSNHFLFTYLLRNFVHVSLQPSKGESSQRQSTESESAPAPTVRNPTRLNCTTVEGLGQAHAESVVRTSGSVSCYALKLVDRT